MSNAEQKMTKTELYITLKTPYEGLGRRKAALPRKGLNRKTNGKETIRNELR